MKRDITLFIEDIFESITRIESFSKGLSKERFEKDELRQSAIVRQLEIIGEAVKNLPNSFRKKYPKVRWEGVAGFRDVLTHGYFRVDLNLVWKIMQEDLPDLKEEILKIKKDLEAGNKK